MGREGSWGKEVYIPLMPFVHLLPMHIYFQKEINLKNGSVQVGAFSGLLGEVPG